MAVIMKNNNTLATASGSDRPAAMPARPGNCEETWRTLFRLLPVGVSIMDSRGRMQGLNPALEQILGLSSDDILNGRYRDRRYLQPDGQPYEAASFPTTRAMREQTTIRQEVIGIVKEDGNTIWVEVSAAPLPFADAACVTVTVDITDLKQAREAADANLHFAEAVADNVTSMLGYWSRDLRCAFANRAYLTWFGRTPEQMRGIRMEELLGPELFSLNRPYIEAVLRGENPQFERLLTKADGERCYVWAQYIAHRVDGEVQGFFVIITDITDFKRQQELQASERQYRRLAEDMPLFIATGEPDGTLTYVNQVLASAFSLTQADMTGLNFYTLLTPADQAMVRGKLAALTPDSPLETHEETHPRADGSTVYLRWTNRAFFDAQGRMTGFQSVGQDITALKRGEQALHDLNRQLEQRVAERTRKLDSTCDELRLRNRQFQSLAADLVQTEDRERRRIARILHDNQQQLLVAAKLTVSRMAARSPDPGVQDMATELMAILGECIDGARALTMELAPPIFRDAGFAAGMHWLARWMQEKHDLTVAVECDTALPGLTEETSLTLFHAVRELLFNIVKHSEAKCARLRLFASAAGLTIVVSDSGCGFDPGHAITRQQTFGLFNIRERLALLNGTMTVNSQPGHGAEITLQVPAAGEDAADTDAVFPPDTTASPKGRPARANRHRIRLLVVDDHAVLRQGLVQLLGKEPDMEIVGEAVDGLDAVEKAQALRPDVTLMDVSMPRLNGLEATRRITAELPQIRIIGLSMHARDEMAEEMLAAGAKAYLVKSCPMDEILAAVRAL